MNTLLHFLLLLCQSCCSLRNVSFGCHIVGLIKCLSRLAEYDVLIAESAYRGWLSMMTSSEGPLFSLASGPPNLKPTTDCYAFHLRRCPF